jgi:hypothetical protein
MDKVLEAALRTIEALEYQIASHHLRIKRQRGRVADLKREQQIEVAETLEMSSNEWRTCWRKQKATSAKLKHGGAID